jgi:hypothetical protein
LRDRSSLKQITRLDGLITGLDKLKVEAIDLRRRQSCGDFNKIKDVHLEKEVSEF